MPKTYEGKFSDAGGRYALVVARFNDFITKRLLDGALDTLQRNGIDVENRASVVWVPGAMEMPLAVKKVAESGRYDAVIALGCVIRGGTPHFDFVAGEVSKGVSAAALSSGVPVAFGVLTTNTIEQALERAGTKMGNKGAEAALAALEMVSLLRTLEEG